ncbi:MAG: Dephospho-CoA kinase [Firmicutes bacterium]|nr:Dephospho-CoA kinase [Bacillota bacterium]
MYVIGLTGGIASGKSSVSDILRKLGACVVDADQLARQIVEPDQPAWQEIVAHFGKAVLLPDGHLNRKLLGNIVFNSPSDREVLNKITHSRIFHEMEETIFDMEKRGHKIIVLDVPLLLEANFADLVDEVWVVYVNEEVEMERLQKRDHLTADEAKARIRSQMPLREKLRYATIVIDNEGDLAATARQVEKAWAEKTKTTE